MVPAVGQAPGGAATDARVSGWAIAALVLGILSPFTCMLTALPAVIAGIVALVKIGKSDGRRKGLGMAIAGMALPVVLLPIMAVGMGIMIPALAKVRQLAFRMTCGENLVGLGKAMAIYANDNNGRFPTSSKWCDLLVDRTQVAPTLFRCHGDKEGPCNYAMNKFAAGLGPGAPANMVLLFETYPGWNQVGGAEILTVENHNGDGCNVLFMDGHAGFVKPEFLRQLQWMSSEPPGYRPAPESLEHVRPR
jgi:prepilin-type processing-associated H-X9-DG protein